MNRQTKLNLILFLGVIFGFAAFNLLYPESSKQSNLEQRDLTKRPAFSAEQLFKGAFTRDYDNYFSDHVVFRTSLVEAGAEIKQLKGVPEKERVSIVTQTGNNMDGGQTAAQPNQTAVDVSQYLVLNDRAFTVFKYEEAAAARYAEVLNRFRDQLDPAVRAYVLLAPSSAEFSDNKYVQDLSDSQQEAIAEVYQRLDSAITPVDSYTALADHRDEYTYFRTDHHWTALGAYYAYAEFMKSAAEEPVPLDGYKKASIKGFLGTAYKQTLSIQLKGHPDDLDYYIPSVEYNYLQHTTSNKATAKKVVDPNFAKYSSSAYAVFLGGDYPWGEIKTKLNNGKRLLVIKDSYANTLIPFLLPHFEEIDYIDPRSYKGSITDFVEEHEITDVLFLNSSSVARTDGIASLIEEKI